MSLCCYQPQAPTVRDKSRQQLLTAHRVQKIHSSYSCSFVWRSQVVSVRYRSSISPHMPAPHNVLGGHPEGTQRLHLAGATSCLLSQHGYCTISSRKPCSKSEQLYSSLCKDRANVTDLVLNHAISAVMFTMYVIFITNVSITMYRQIKQKKLLYFKRQIMRHVSIAL